MSKFEVITLTLSLVLGLHLLRARSVLVRGVYREHNDR